jgi:hypothetical protein
VAHPDDPDDPIRRLLLSLFSVLSLGDGRNDVIHRAVPLTSEAGDVISGVVLSYMHWSVSVTSVAGVVDD